MVVRDLLHTLRVAYGRLEVDLLVGRYGHVQAAIPARALRAHEVQLAEDPQRGGDTAVVHLRAGSALGDLGGEFGVRDLESVLVPGGEPLEGEVELCEIVPLRGDRPEDQLVEPGVPVPEEGVDVRGRPVTTGPPRHLVELHRVERHVVVHDVADVRDVHTLAERARRHHARHVTLPERLLDRVT